ncbi:hypothetical protein OAC45_01080 [Gammaproteobacteria bacterium]|nr:hypothetical protein [Gammaproteobacteria bacterium]|tara:strand:+ start:660 stop:1400 length:741 start_codon:yes stop_codon:yes gene_type:complete
MMKVGDQVVFSNLNKKSTLQIEIFEKSSENKTVWVETYWRGGLFKITFMHNYEIDAFKEILDGGDEYELETDDFEFCELLETYDSQSIEIDSKTFSSVEELDNNGYDITKEYYIIFNGIKLDKESSIMDIDLSKIEKKMTQAEAIKEFIEPTGMEDVKADSFDRPGYWAIAMSWGEAESEVYLGENLDDINSDLLSFSEYGVNFDPMGENPGDKKFESIQKEDRLILCSHPDSDPNEDCDIFIKIK